MTLSELISAARDATRLLAGRPLRWLLAFTILYIAIEALMFIPYVGFVAKLSAAGIAGAGVLAMFARASSGAAPRIVGWISAFTLPASTQAVLGFAGLLPFLAGVLCLYWIGGTPAIRIFFGVMGVDKPPAPEMFLYLKYVMTAASLPFVFVGGAVVVGGLRGLAALQAGLRAAATNLLPVVVTGVLDCAFVWMADYVTQGLTPVQTLVWASVLTILYIAWMTAFGYALSLRVFAGSSSLLRREG